MGSSWCGSGWGACRGREYVAQAHEGDQVAQLVGRMVQPDLAPVPPRRELEAREGVDRHRVGLDPPHVAHRGAGGAPLEQRADALAEPG